MTQQFLPPSAPATQHAWLLAPPFLRFFPRLFPPASLPSSEAKEVEANLRAFGVSIIVSKLVSPEMKRPSIADPARSLE